MTDQQAIDLIETQSRQLDTIWLDFVTWRRDVGDPVIMRRSVLTLPPDVAQFAKGLNVQSPQLEDWLNSHINAQMLNPTKIDAKAQEDTATAKSAVADAAIWYASHLRRFDADGKLTRGTAQGHWQYGLACYALEYHQPEEEDDDEFDVESQALAEYVEEMMGKREEYYSSLAMHPDYFKLRLVSPLTLEFWPLDDPDIYLETTVHSYVDAKQWTSSDGKKINLLKDMKTVVILGEGAPEYGTDEAAGEGRITLRRSAQRDEHGHWTMREYVSAGELFDSKNCQLFDERPCPTKPYFYVPNGQVNLFATDPHLRFRPGMYSAIVAQYKVNTLDHLITALAMRNVSIGSFYMTLPPNITPEFVNQLTQLGFGMEVVGGEKRVVIPLPRPGANEIPVLPRLERWPTDIDDALQLSLQAARQELESFRPSRLLSDPARQNATNSTATVWLDVRQADKLPYSANVEKLDDFIEELCYALRTCVLRWEGDTEEGAGKRYPVVTTGQEPCISAPPEPGKMIWVDYNKMRHSHVIQSITRNISDEEKMRADQQAEHEYYELKELTPKGYFERKGVENPEAHIEELREQEIETAMWERVGMPALLSEMTSMLARLTEDPTIAAIVQQSQMTGQAPPPMREQAPPPPVSGPQVQPAVTPAPVGGQIGSGGF